MQLDEKFYKTLMDNLAEGVYFTDKDKNIKSWNKGAEKITGYKSHEVIGTKCSDNILIHVDEKGQVLCKTKGVCPLSSSIAKGISNEANIYLQHKDGHRIPVQVKTIPIKDPNDKIIGGVEIFTDTSTQVATDKMVKELKQKALHDHVTGLANREFMESQIKSRLSGFRKYGWSFGIILMLVSDIKKINELHGQDVGDTLLKITTNTLLKSSRNFDIIAKWSGTEFVAIIQNVNEVQLHIIANKYRALVEQSGLNQKSETIKVSMHTGVALARTDDTMEKLIKRADKQMRESKKPKKDLIP